MTRKRKPPEDITLRERVRRWVVEHGPCTIAQITLALGRYISAARAVQEGKRLLVITSTRTDRRYRTNPANPIYTTEHLASGGRRNMVTNNVSELARDGLLARVSRGVYGPPPPKLFQPAESA